MHFLLTFLLLVPFAAPTQQAPAQKPHLPAFQTAAELLRDSNSALLQFMTDHPELYGITEPPPSGFVMYPEFTAVDAMYMVYDDTQRNYYLDLIEAATRYVDVVIWHSNEESSIRSTLQANLSQQAFSRVSLIDFYNTPHYVFSSPYQIDSAVDSIWAVDFGPFFIRNSSGEVAITDPHYYFERINDNAIPDKMGDLLGMTVYHPDLAIEGGNLFSDGLGTCYSTTMVHENNPKYTAAQIDQIMDEYFGCKKMIWLSPLSGEGTGHIDMFFILASPTDVIVGSFTASQDSTNKTVMDDNAALLEGQTNFAGDPLVVHRIPMPNPGQDYYGRVWRSYTNGLRLNDGYLVPVFEQHTAYQIDAMNVLAEALPGVTLETVPADDIMPWGGAIHCTTRSKPVGPAFHAATAPAYTCGGAPFCDDCTDECTAGEAGCMEDGNRYMCGNADMDSCMERIVINCPAQAPCENGTCGGEDCTDACTPWGTGCTDDAHRFVCAEEGDGDFCVEPVSFACANGRTCSGGICIPSSGTCGEITFTGECQGDISVWCEDGELAAYDCASDGMTCGWSESDGYYDCVPRSACTDECTAGTARCADGATLEVCAEAFDGDRCMDWKSTACAEGTECRGDACRAPCADACVPGETVCTDDATSAECVYDEETACHVLAPTECQEGFQCRDGACVKKKKSDGCSCAAGTKAPRDTPVFFGFLLAFGIFLTRRFRSL